MCYNEFRIVKGEYMMILEGIGLLVDDMGK